MYNHKFLHLDAEQGRVEQRTEPYIKYGSEVAETLTPLCAKSFSEVASFAGKQVEAMEDL